MLLERHLLALGAERPYTIPWSELGKTLSEPLREGQLVHMELLAKLYEARKEVGRAVEVLAATGRAAVDAEVPPARRPDRVRLFGDAKLHVRALCGVHIRTYCALHPAMTRQMNRVFSAIMTGLQWIQGFPSSGCNAKLLHDSTLIGGAASQAQAMRDDTLAATMDYDLHLAMLQQELLAAVDELIAASAVDAEPRFSNDVLEAKQAQLQLQSLSASELFNAFAMVRASLAEHRCSPAAALLATIIARCNQRALPRAR
jgi:hypothetical protein